MRVPRTRGAVSGLLVALLGVWGALIPFIGPSFDLAIGPDDAWHWTTGRFWLSVLPGIVAIVGGLMLMLSARRPTASLGALLAVAAGAWFVVGPTVSGLWNHGVSQAGTPHGSSTTQVIAELTWFLGVGALILYLGATALGRLSVRSVRDVELAQESAVEPVGAPTAGAETDAAAQPAPAAGSTTTVRRRRGGVLGLGRQRGGNPTA
jgi:hypothetical protein